MSSHLTAEQWRADLRENWSNYYQKAKKLGFTTHLATVLATVLWPLHSDGKKPSDGETVGLTQIGEFLPAYHEFAKLLSSEERDDVKQLVSRLLAEAEKNPQLQDALNLLILESGILTIFHEGKATQLPILEGLLSDAWRLFKEPSGVRVVIEQIISGGNVIIAGRDANLVQNSFSNNIPALKAYLASLRAEWNRPDLSRIFPTYHHADYSLHVHNLFTPMDVWRHNEHEVADDEELIQLRFKAVNNELDESRRSVIETIAAYPYLVITGAAGTGKSYLARFLAICMAYACDYNESNRQQVDGLKLLGNSWVHGSVLPVYIPMRNFANSAYFPESVESATATSLLNYVCELMGQFGKDFEQYMVATDTVSYSAILILDGLDEVGTENDRQIIQHVIEQWADRFSSCRILVTSRTYAYKQTSKWRLSARFRSAELAPFSRKQINAYITDWYNHAAQTRPSAFGGKEVANEVTSRLAEHLNDAIRDDESPLLPLMRQPLLLAMLTLIHETRKQLPDKDSELYEATIDLLNRWMPYAETGGTSSVPNELNYRRLLDALKLAAFHLQCKQKSYQKYPGTLNREELHGFLVMQHQLPGGLGVSPVELLEYLGTRNGLLLSDRSYHYRFPHLSIQEYLAAAALIELYDECQMPDELSTDEKRVEEDLWTFPENLRALLSNDPYRWRNVALFVGAIISGNKGQDGRWTLIEELLPTSDRFSLEEETVFRIYIAGEIWASEYLKARLPSHLLIRERLLKCLETIQMDDRLDAPERNQTKYIAEQLYL